MHGRALAVLLIGSAITLDLSWSIVQVQASPRSRGAAPSVDPPVASRPVGCRASTPRVRAPRPARTRLDGSLVPAPTSPPGMTDAECASKRALRRADRTPAAYR